MKFDKVLVAIDGSTLSDSAVDLALNSANIFGAHLTFVNVVDIAEASNLYEIDADPRIFALQMAGNSFISKAQKQAESMGIGTDSLVTVGVPWQVLSEKSKEYDMVIMSVVGKGAFGTGRMGSTACKTIENAHCPILTLKSTSRKVENVLLPVETDDVPAIDVAIETVKRINGELTVLYVKHKADAVGDPIDGVSKKCEAAGIRFSTAVLEGNPAQVICAESGKYDLVVMGTHGRVGIKKALKGSVAESVMLNAACPVTVVRNN